MTQSVPTAAVSGSSQRPPQAPPVPKGASRKARTAWAVVPPGVLLAGILAWWVKVEFFNVPTYLAPATATGGAAHLPGPGADLVKLAGGDARGCDRIRPHHRVGDPTQPLERLLRGWVYAIDHRNEAIQDRHTVFPPVKGEETAATLKVTPPLFSRGDAKCIGKAEPAHWAEATKLLDQVGMLPAGTQPWSSEE